MKYKFAILALSVTLCTEYFCAQEITLSGKLTTEAGIALPNINNVDNAGKFTLGTTTIQADSRVDANESSFYINANASYDALSTELSATLKEAWYDYNGSWWALRIGRQINAWGAADGIQIVDVLCPKDETKLLASEYSESRLGIDAVRLSYLGESITADFYCIPFFTPSTLPLKDSNPLKSLIMPRSVTAQGITLAINSFTEDNITTPELKIQNAEYALKVSSYLPFADLSLYGFYGLNSTYTAIDLSAEYKRMAMIGFDSSIPIGEIVLRLEGAFFPNRYINTSAESQLKAQISRSNVQTSVQRNETSALIGIDWMPSSWTLTAQYYADIAFGEISDLDRERYEHLASLHISKSFLQDTLSLSLEGMIEFNDFSSVVQAELSYSLSDQITLSILSQYFFEGPNEKGSYGKYEDLSGVVLKGSFSF